MSRKLLSWALLFLIVGAVFLSISARADDDALNEEEESESYSEDELSGTAGSGSSASGATGGAAGSSSGGPKAAGSDEYEEEEEEYEEDAESSLAVLTPSPDVQTIAYLPDFPDKRLVQGEEIRVLLGFHNSGSKSFNLSYVGAHLHSPFDFSYYIQNFSVREIGAVVGSGDEVSVEYSFKPDASLEPLEFWLSAWVIYNNSDNEQFRSVFFNGTVELIEKKSDLDAKQLFSYFLFAAIFGLAAYFAFQFVSSKKPKKRSERGTKDVLSSWDTEIYTPAKDSKPFGSSKKRKANKQ